MSDEPFSEDYTEHVEQPREDDEVCDVESTRTDERRKLAERLRWLRAYDIGRYGVRLDAEGWLVFRSDIEAIIAELEGETGGDS